MPDPGAFFTAKFDSECTECGTDIEAGDGAGFVDDQVVCAEDYSAAAQEAGTYDPYGD